jgi:predicted metalloprotease
MTAVKTLNVELLAGLPPGTWAAISSDQERIVGTGQTVEQALAAAQKNGEDKPFLVRAPSENSTLIL